MPLEIRTAGIVLARRDLHEADRLLTILTAEMGLLTAIARGVRRPRSRLAATLEPFRSVNLRLHRGAGELFLIVGAHWQTAEPTILKAPAEPTLPALAQLFAAAEITLRLLPPEKPAPAVWQIWQELLAILNENELPQWLPVAVPARLLAALGYLPEDFATPRLTKLLRFLAVASFTETRRLAFDAVLLAAARTQLHALAEAAAERELRVPRATAGWD